MRFKTWIEQVLLEDDQPLRKQQQEQVGKLYQQVVQLLLGGAKNQTNLSLSDIEDDSSGPGSPPVKKGAQVVLAKLEKAQVFNRIDSLQIPSLTQRAHDVQNYLQKIANDQQVGPKDTVGELLNKLFGDNAVELYGKGLWKASPGANQQPPEDNQTPPDNATTPPVSQDQPPPPAPAAPQSNPSAGGMPPPMGAPPMPGQPPAGGMPPMPGMPPQPGMPPDPTQMLQSPGGPLPPRPAPF
jgi:hypothetical protein